jgi:deferrochelatase/peroxidase EfeB
VTPFSAGEPDDTPSGVQRRRFLQGAAAVMGTAAVGSAVTLGVESGSSSAGAASPASYAFQGVHQAGILDDRQAYAAYLAFDFTAANRGELTDLLQVLTQRARLLTAGGPAQQLGITAPPSDSGILGDPAPAGGLTITVGLGASAFDDRFGLADGKPKQLRQIDTFPNDNLDRSRCDGDLIMQFCAHDADTVIHAFRDITRHTRGAMQPRWRLNGFVPPPRPAGTPRNLMGFRDGTANPNVALPKVMDELVWVQPNSAEPSWAANGSYMVVRVIRMLVEFWDRVTITEQEKMIGRRRVSGAPLTGSTEFDRPNYSNDPQGASIPLDAHIRVANPRTAKTNDNRILRRGYNYDLGIDVNGNLDQGLIFTCFQQDLDRQFVTVQKRLIDEPLVDYISPVGGGYFYALPGVRDRSDWYARQLLAD